MDIRVIDHFSQEQCQSIENLEKQVFPHTYRPGRFTEEAPFKKGLMGLAIEDRGHYVAYKVGYELKPNTFYSWVGGVHPNFRGRGIGKKLMEYQHKLLKERKYNFVRTKTRMGFRTMLILNLKNGFDITGLSYKAKLPGLVIQMEKPL